MIGPRLRAGEAVLVARPGPTARRARLAPSARPCLGPQSTGLRTTSDTLRDEYGLAHMADDFDPAALIERFRERSRAVKSRGIPPIEGPERKRFVDRMQLDFMDFAMLGDATATLEDGILTLRVDLRPPTSP